MRKTHISGWILARLPKIWAPKIFSLNLLLLVVNIVPSYYPMQFKEKLLSHTWENGEKHNFGPNFDPFGQNVVPRFFP